MRPRNGEVVVAFVVFCVMVTLIGCGLWAAWVRLMTLARPG